jgi:hypothetical protein
MALENPRLERERETIAAMLHCYCRGVHGSRGVLCGECKALLDYAVLRLERCPFGESKPTCAQCPIHCYQPRLREQVKAVMSYAGPRMIWRHPILALRHMLDAWRKVPPLNAAQGEE